MPNGFGRSRNTRKGKNKTSSQQRKPCGLPPTNFELLGIDFADIISDIRNGIGDLPTSSKCHRRTICLRDGSRVHATEYITSDDEIDYFYYDWVSPKNNVIMEFHSEYHIDPLYQTRTEPFHIQFSALHALSTMDRLPNYEHRSLRSMVEYISLVSALFSAFDKDIAMLY